MTDIAYVDLETRSLIDLPKHGSYAYWEDPSTDVLIACYAIGDGPVSTWLRGDPMPAALAAHIRAGGVVSGWNASGFERLAFDRVLGPRYGWPVPRLEQWSDTMHMAVAMAIPASLGRAAAALGLDVQKNKEGMRLIRKFSIPTKDKTFQAPEDHPVDFGLFAAYCKTDVEVERAARARLVPLSDAERRVAMLDATINDRGLRIDVTSARAAVALAERAKGLIDQDVREATHGEVRRVSEVGKLKAWAESRGVFLDSLDKATISDTLAKEDVPEDVRRVLELRAEGGKTSVTKIAGFLDRASCDGRVRGCYTYHGANTGRWSSTGVNVSNLPRTRKEYDDAKLDVALLFDTIRSADPAYVQALYGPKLGRPMHLLSDAVRGFIWAAPGHDFVQADYSNIEGSVIAWLAREEWKLEAIRDIFADPDNIPDLYRQTAARILGLPLGEVTKKHWARQAIGKTSELSLGFGGGASAFVTMAHNYRVDLDSLYAPVWETATDEDKEKATKRYEFCFARNQSGARSISRNAWIACETIKRGWRAQNSAIAQSWRDAESAAREAIEAPGYVTEAIRCRFVVRFGYLWVLLPSGRALCFPKPSLSSQVWVSVKDANGHLLDAEVMEREAAERLELAGKAAIQGDTSPAISFWGVDAKTKQWTKKKTYGGDLVQSATQATARDVLVNGMFRAEDAGYRIVLHTYDEMLCEVPRGFGDLAEFERLICDLPAWADGMPIAAGGWRGKRYRKD
jgi:DNA polymerase